MSAPRPAPLRLAALDDLPDGELQAVIARAQSLLLDRPIAPESAPALAVEIVGREERRLLIFYRALAPPRVEVHAPVLCPRPQCPAGVHGAGGSPLPELCPRPQCPAAAPPSAGPLSAAGLWWCRPHDAALPDPVLLVSWPWLHC